MDEDLIRQVMLQEQRLDGLVKPEILVVGAVIIHDQKASGTAGGAFTSGALRTRDLNTTVKNTLGSGYSLAANQFTLPPGIYITLIFAPAIDVDQHACRLQNITDGAMELEGTSEYSRSGNLSSQTPSIIVAPFTITASKVFEVQHRCATTQAGNGFGTPTTWATTNEIYTIVKLWKIG